MMKKSLTVITTLLLLLPPSAPFWLNYLLGYGGHEHALINGMLLVGLLTWAMVFASLWVVISAIISVIRHRQIALPMLKAGIVVSLAFTLVLPNYVAKQMRTAGACARIATLGGERFVHTLQEDAQAMVDQVRLDHSGHFDSSDLPPSFVSLGVKYAQVQTPNGKNRVDATTSGRPFRTGWIIVSAGENDPSGPTTVQIADNVYRY
jgi:hypothetical protein